MAKIYRILLFSIYLVFNVSTNFAQSDSTFDSSTYDYCYLQEDSLLLEDSSSFFAQAIENHQYFFVGESHNFWHSNHEIQIRLIKHLKKQKKLKHVIFEYGFSHVEIINQYVSTGDSSAYRLLQSFTDEISIEFYDNLRAINDSSSAENQLQLHGIDVEKSTPYVVKYISESIDTTAIWPDSIASELEFIQSVWKDINHKIDQLEDLKPRLDKVSKNEYLEASRVLLTKFNLLQTVLIKDRIDRVHKILKSILIYSEYIDKNYMSTPKIRRERFMHQELKSLMDQYPDDVFFGQFGRCHIEENQEDVQCNSIYFKSMIHRIRSEENYSKKVLSLPTTYTFMQRNTEESKFNELIEELIVEKHPVPYILLDTKTPDETVLINLVSNSEEYGKIYSETNTNAYFGLTMPLISV